jgi:hypothetical protein
VRPFTTVLCHFSSVSAHLLDSLWLAVALAQAAAYYCTATREAAAGAAVRLPLWLLVSPRTAADAAPGGSGGAAARRRLLGGGGTGGPLLLEDLLLLGMPDDGSRGRGAFWEGEEYDGSGTADDDDANLSFREVGRARAGLFFRGGRQEPSTDA